MHGVLSDKEKEGTAMNKRVAGYLDYMVTLFNNPSFIQGDPVSIPHLFKRKEDVEISAFFASTFAWGNRRTAIKSVSGLMERMDQSPYCFVSQASEKELVMLDHFSHRTFNGADCRYFILSLRRIYERSEGLEGLFTQVYLQCETMKETISEFRKHFFSKNPGRSAKHIGDPMRNSAAKRINLFLRWMVRKDNMGVDFGIWNRIAMKDLMIPLDLHVSATARKLGLLHRRSDDWQAVEELTGILRSLDPEDPVKYDFALFGAGLDPESISLAV